MDTFTIIPDLLLSTIAGGGGSGPNPNVGKPGKGPPQTGGVDLSKVDWGHAAQNGLQWAAGGGLAGAGIGLTAAAIVGAPTGPFDLAVAADGAQVGGTIGGIIGFTGGFVGDIVNQSNHH